MDHQVSTRTNRTKRGSFDFGCEILGSLFGVTTASGINNVSADIGKVVDRMQAQEKVLKVVVEDTHKYVKKVNEITLAVNNISKQLIDFSKEHH